ncbi:MAG: PilZ domain-containing protein [Thermodesulfobacteriota bacterium]
MLLKDQQMKREADMEACADRRKSRRFPVEGTAIAVFQPYPILMGQVIDISMGGLAFHYLQEKKCTDHPPQAELTIICSDGTKLERIPYRIVSDIDLSPMLSFVSKPLRRASLQFGDLTDSQAASLSLFIEGCSDVKKDSGIQFH